MIVADRLAQLHFTAREDAPADLQPVQTARLDSFLRGMLFTDGTVSRALEAHTLTHVAVETVQQEPSAAPAPIARHLRVDEGEECVRRRIVMRLAPPSPSVWAESYLVPHRLPAQFLAVLGASPLGIGGSLQQLKLESSRELLWFGLGHPPSWSDEAAHEEPALTRAYRVLTQGLPALIITESFAVELRAGLYHLVGAAPAA